MKLNILLLFFVLFFASSCISDEESARQVNSGFQGNWKGNFNGDENGTINFTVQKEGTIVGEITLNPNNAKESINGYVNFNGKFDMNTKSNIIFSGYLINLDNSQTTGNWTRNNVTGNFNFQKQ